MVWTIVAGALIYVNWQVFLVATLTGHVVETSLGYFINPIVTVLLGVLVLHERLRVAQWIALGIATAAVLVIIVGYHSFPWIALSLAFSFGLYGLVKKQIGPSVDAVSGLTLESLWLTPIAVIQLVVVGVTTGLTIGSGSTAAHGAAAARRSRDGDTPALLRGGCAAGAADAHRASCSSSHRSCSSASASGCCTSRCPSSAGSASGSCGWR